MLIEHIIKKLKIHFKNDLKRLNHIMGVYRTAIKLARFYKADMFQVQVASLFHDYTKNEPLDFHLSCLSNDIIKRYQNNQYVYHAFSAPIILQKEFKIEDKKILNAIRKHVWGHKVMNKLDKIILLSDKIEPNRKKPHVDYFRNLAFINLNKAVYELLKFQYESYQKKGFLYLDEPKKILESLSKKFFKI